MRNDCKVDPMEIVVQPQDADEQALAASFKGAIPFVAGGSTTVTEAYRSYGTFTASYTNLAPSIATVLVTRWAPDDSGFFSGLSKDNPPSTAVLTFATQASAGAVVISQFRRLSATQTLRQRILGSVQSYGVDAPATLLPWLGPPSYDAATRKLTVPVDSTGTTTTRPDAFQALASYRCVVAGTTTTFNWRLYAPAPADLALPQLPQELADLAPRPGEQLVIGDSMMEVNTVTDYDALRSTLDTTFQAYQPTGRRPPGTSIRISSYAQPRLP